MGDKFRRGTEKNIKIDLSIIIKIWTSLVLKTLWIMVMICGAEAEDDCLDDCQGLPVPPQLYGLVEEQMAYVTHRVSRKLMKEFKMKLFTEKLENILADLPEYKSFARAMVNSKTLQTADSVLDFLQNQINIEDTMLFGMS